MNVGRVVVMWCLVATGCGACGGPPSSSHSSGDPSTANQSNRTRSNGKLKGDAEARIALTGTPSRYRTVEIRLRVLGLKDRAEHEARLKRTARIEQKTKTGWRALSNTPLLLTDACGASAKPCLELVPGAELEPDPWLARQGKPQCPCSDCPEVKAGEYRFVATSCDDSKTYPGTPFTLP